MNKRLRLQLYKTLKRYVIDYGIINWYPTSKKDLQLIEKKKKKKKKKRAKKIIPEMKECGTSRELNLTTLLYRRQRCVTS